MSTGSASTSATLKAFGADSENSPKPITAACKTTDVVRPVFIGLLLAILFLERDEAQVVVSGCRNSRHDLHDGAIVRRLVTPHIDALVISCLGDRLEFRHDLLDRDFGFLEV